MLFGVCRVCVFLFLFFCERVLLICCGLGDEYGSVFVFLNFTIKFFVFVFVFVYVLIVRFCILIFCFLLSPALLLSPLLSLLGFLFFYFLFFVFVFSFFFFVLYQTRFNSASPRGSNGSPIPHLLLRSAVIGKIPHILAAIIAKLAYHTKLSWLYQNLFCLVSLFSLVLIPTTNPTTYQPEV